MQGEVVARKGEQGQGLTDFEPRIIAFCCNFCAGSVETAALADSRLPANVRVIRVPCSGKVETLHLLRAIETGADGVMVVGCLEGDCHFLSGNLRARNRVNAAKKLIEKAGIEPERLEMYNLSSSRANKFAELAREMSGNVRELGPSPLGKEVTK